MTSKKNTAQQFSFGCSHDYIHGLKGLNHITGIKINENVRKAASLFLVTKTNQKFTHFFKHRSEGTKLKLAFLLGKINKQEIENLYISFI